MKKFLIVLLIFAVTISGVFAEGENGASVEGSLVDSGSIVVRGKIGIGEVYFNVQDSGVPAIDLVENLDIQPEGAGVLVGKWNFAASSQPENTTFTVNISTTPLTSPTVGGSYAFDVTEEGSGGSYVNNVITVTGNSILERNIKVNLKNAIPEGALPAGDYKGTIILSLTTGSSAPEPEVP